jgi:hypothetical protein
VAPSALNSAHRFRLVGLLALAWMAFVGPSRAVAMGCHVDDRPRFGLSRPFDGASREFVADTSAKASTGTHQIVPEPCSEEMPGARARSAQPPASDLSAEPSPEPQECSEILRFVDISRRPESRSHIPERPPRRMGIASMRSRIVKTIAGL